MSIEKTIGGITLAFFLSGTARAQQVASPAEPNPRDTAHPNSPATSDNTNAVDSTSKQAPAESDAALARHSSTPEASPAAAVPPEVASAAPVAPIPPPEVVGTSNRVNPEAPLETGPVPIKGKWSPVMYGFVEFDSMHDSTQSFNDSTGNGVVADPKTYAGNHARTTFGMRNSRLGFKLSAPESNGIKTTGILEMDFLGNQPSNPPATSEVAFFSSPTFRARHYALKMETPYVDILLGQYWQLFGWQTYFHPNTVEIQGVPGQVFSRSPQARLSHVFKSSSVNVELAVAASRPPQRDSGSPDGQGGLRIMFNNWKGVHTMGGAGTAADAAAIGVSGVARRLVVPEYSAAPMKSHHTYGWGVSTDVLLPVIPASLEDRSNALSLTGSWVVGRGIADLFTGLTDGATASWALPTPPGATAAPTYSPDIDSGLVEVSQRGTFHPIKWQVFIGGIQYYLPPTGHVWVSANYSHMKSSNILDFVTAKAKATLFDQAEWYDGNLFWDVSIATRLGMEYAHIKQTYGDDTTRINHRVQFSGWLIF